jgi:[protein-PII] uridylyltransferase
MHSLGVLAAYWPAFGRIVGHMQYDLYHVYTVDHHILTVLTEARRLSDNKRTEDDISAIFHSLPKLEILYLAALFHDVAKGRDGDHSTEGSEESMQFCLDHGLSQYDATMVSWLVENHLIMSITAQHKDLNEPSVIQKFTDQVSNVIRLNYLYLLTIADIKGTNPTLWNNWRSTLLADLYKYTAFQLRAESPRDNSAIIKDIKSSALTQLEQQGFDRQECQQFWQSHHQDYFLRHTDDEIAWHTHIALSPNNESNTHVHARVSQQRGSTEIFIYTPDKAHLFAQLTDCLHTHNLSILDARIITSKTGMTFNTFNVTDHLGAAVDRQEQLQIIQNDIKDTLIHNILEHNQVGQFVSTRMLHFQVPAVINIKNAEHLEYTVLHIHASDHPGLLANIAQALTSADIKVIGARVSTLGEKVHDIFHITHMDDSKIIDDKDKQSLTDYLQIQLAPADNQQTSYTI